MKKSFILLLILQIGILSLAFATDLAISPQVSAPESSRTTYTAPYTQNFNGSWPPADWYAPYVVVNYMGFDFGYDFVQLYSQACVRFSPVFSGVTTHLYSPYIYVPGPMYRLKFKWSHGQLNTYNADYGAVYVNQTKVWQLQTTEFNSNDGYSDNNPGSGVLESIDLSRWAGEYICITFEGLGNSGPYWYIDDFAVEYVDTRIKTFPNTQTFSSATFPPQYWSVPGSWDAPGSNPFWRSDANAYGATGNGSALCSFENFVAGRSIDMRTQFVDLGPYGGTLSYDYAYSPYLAANPNESLDIDYSNDYGQSFYYLADYNASSGGGLITAAPHSGGGWTPGATDWATKTLALPPGANMVKFHGISAYNGRLFIDNVKFEKNLFASGDGTEGNPYMVSSAAELNLMRNYLGSASSRKYFKLANNIDLPSYLASGGEGYTAWGSNGWLPLGNGTSPFYGGLDGDGHSISGLRTWYYGTYHGLFGCTASGSMIKNLSMGSDCNILGDAHTSSLVGYSAGSITNCSSAASVSIGNASNGGGIVGTNVGSVSYCTFTGTVSRSGSGVSANALGGIVGKNESTGVVSKCRSNSTISGSAWTGGIAGWNDGSISLCKSTGTISAYSNSNGGLVGQNNGNINNSYSRCNVSGAQYIGGLVGYNINSTITNSYSTGTVGGGQKGGLCGQSGATVTNSYWDTQTSGISTSYGGTGKTTAQMKSQATFTGWDFLREIANGTADYWGISSTDNNGYPLLAWEVENEIRAPILIAPADLATNIPKAGFELSWTENQVGMLPTYYNVYMMRYTSPGVMEEHLFLQQAGTSFYPVIQGGLVFDYGDTWYWTVEAASWAGTVRTLPLRSLQIEANPFIDAFPYVQTFASATFPPTFWNNAGWYLHDANGYGATGTGSIQAHFFSMNTGTTCDLITATIDTHGMPGILSFDHAYATFTSGENDKLEIWYSIDSGANYNLLTTYNGGADGPLVTAPPYEYEFVPSASQWATKSIDLPTGTNKLKFRGVSSYGNNLYLDNITINTSVLAPPANVRVFIDAAAAVYELRWDNTPGAGWYGIYQGNDPLNLQYVGWTNNHSIGFVPVGKSFYRVSAGSGSTAGVNLDSK